MNAKVVLISNYLPDDQRSMLRFSRILEREMQRHGSVETIRPPVVLRRFRSTKTLVNKWLGYVDKYAIFPAVLVAHRLRAKWRGERCLYHICDHSNAVYESWLRGAPAIVTCHDVLAVRGAAGDPDAWCPAGRTGRLLQKWILYSLRNVPFVACDSTATRDDLARLGHEADPVKCPVIVLAADSTFGESANEPLASDRNGSVENHRGTYLLTVGSGHPRKNRKALFPILAKARSSDPQLALVMAGGAISAEERDAAARAGVEAFFENPVDLEDNEINALYRGARALLIPSWSEGFGWPIIEAQQAGCPVIASNRTSLPEVAGAGALIFDPDDHTGMAAAAVQLGDPETRAAEVRRGFENLERFRMDRMIGEYRELYRRVLESHA